MKVVILGASGHAVSVISMALEAGQIEIVGCLGGTGTQRTDILGVPVLGGDDLLEKLYEDGIRHAFVAIGENKIRRKLYEKCSEIGYLFPNIISSHAVVSRYAELGAGNCVMAGAVVNAGTVVGNQCILNTNSSIDHDCAIGDYVHVAPGVAVSGSTRIGTGAHIGTGASVIDGLSIADWSYIGAGAAVVKNIETRGLYVGVPARMVHKEGEK